MSYYDKRNSKIPLETLYHFYSVFGMPLNMPMPVLMQRSLRASAQMLAYAHNSVHHARTLDRDTG